MQHIIYGPGGFDPSKPNSNIVSVVEVDETLDAVAMIDQALAAT